MNRIHLAPSFIFLALSPLHAQPNIVIIFTDDLGYGDVEEGKIKPDAPNRQLYHLGDDPNQARNVIRDRPEIATR